jgi:SAM-dependent methyltransferase
MMTDAEAENERRNSSRVHLRRLIAGFAAELPDGSRVLDAGAGRAVYRPLFARQVYETADVHPASTYVCDLHALPIGDQLYDAILTTQTLEHTQEPAVVLSELARVLKPGGRLLLTAPLVYEEHLQPMDFYRFTSFGFRYLIEKAGFEIQEITWLEGFFGTLGYLLRTASHALQKLDVKDYPPIDARIIFGAQGDLALLGQAFNDMDLRRKETSVGFPINYVVRATKK